MVRHTSKILQQCIFSLCIKGLKLFFLSAIIEWNNSNHSLRNGPSVCAFKQNILKFIRYIKLNSCSTNLLEDPVWDWTMNVSIGLLTILVIASISSEFKNLISNLSTISSPMPVIFVRKASPYCESPWCTDFFSQWKWTFSMSYSILR